jgi:hypothetical protein
MRSSWLVIVCSLVALSLAACAPTAASGPEPRYGVSVPHVRETTRIATTATHEPTTATPLREPLRIVTEHERRAHK